MFISSYVIDYVIKLADVEDCPKEDRLSIAKKGLEIVEQVGFITSEQGMPTLEMMGELTDLLPQLMLLR